MQSLLVKPLAIQKTKNRTGNEKIPDCLDDTEVKAKERTVNESDLK